MNRTHTGRVRGRKGARGTPARPHPYRKPPAARQGAGTVEEWQCALPALNPGPHDPAMCQFAALRPGQLRKHFSQQHGLGRAEWNVLQLRLAMHMSMGDCSHRTETIRLGEKTVGFRLKRVYIDPEDRWYP